MLFAGCKLTAVEAHDCGLVTAVFPHNKLMEEVQNRVQAMAKLPPKVIIVFREDLFDMQFNICLASCLYIYH